VTGRVRIAAVALLATAALASVAGAAPGGAAPVVGDWTSFGRTAANDRHSPLTQITPANVAHLERT
jgi:quinoprotein glucose dehydrogenase